MRENVIDDKVCSALVGEGKCCTDCHNGNPFLENGGVLTFDWKGSRVCCEAWRILDEREENELKSN